MTYHATKQTWPGKSVLNTWPVTDVTLSRAGRPSKRPMNSWTGGRPVSDWIVDGVWWDEDGDGVDM